MRRRDLYPQRSTLSRPSRKRPRRWSRGSWQSLRRKAEANSQTCGSHFGKADGCFKPALGSWLTTFACFRVRHHDRPRLARRQIRMARFGIRRAVFVPDLVDLVQATRRGVRGPAVRRHGEQFPPEFDGGNGNNVVCAFPVLGRDCVSVTTFSMVRHEMKERLCSISNLMSSSKPSASGASATACASSARPGRRSAVFQELIDVRAQLGMFADQTADLARHVPVRPFPCPRTHRSPPSPQTAARLTACRGVWRHRARCGWRRVSDRLPRAETGRFRRRRRAPFRSRRSFLPSGQPCADRLAYHARQRTLQQEGSRRAAGAAIPSAHSRSDRIQLCAFAASNSSARPFLTISMSMLSPDRMRF